MSITPDEISRIKRFEGIINHFYLDIKGNVTIGYGHLVANINSSVLLDLIRKKDGLPATIVEKQTEWTTIKSKPFGKQFTADSYDQFCNLSLNQPDIDKLLANDLATTEHQLSANFTDYQHFPQSAKAGLIDMAFNLGIGTLMGKFSNFVASVKKQDWATAAIECNRTGIDPNRNIEVRQLFLQAVKPQPTHPTPPHPTPSTGSTGSMLNTFDVAHWLKQFPPSQFVQPSPLPIQPPTPVTPLETTLPQYMKSNYVESQSIVAIVAISANVTVAAITAITAITCKNKS